MNYMKLPFKKEEFLGNVRSGNRRENNSPRNLSYFEVHSDNYTSQFSIELFRSIYKENPSSLKIKPIDNIFITYEIYNKKIKCMGQNGKATRITAENKRVEGKCMQEECNYCKNGKCSKVGRLYFKLAGIEDRGIWCYTTRSRGVDYIQKYLDFMKEKNINITEMYFLLSLNERNGQSGKVYVPDIKLFQETNKNVKTENKSNKENEHKQQKVQSAKQVSNSYRYVKGTMVNYEGNKIPELVFANNNGVEKALYLTKESKKDILKLRPGTIIAITKTTKNEQNNMIFLKDYNVLKAVTQQNNINKGEKKAV